MNRKTYIVSLILVLVFLAAQLCLKFIFPETFLIVVEEPHLVLAGNFIMNHRWLYLIILCLIGVLSDHLYFGAVCQTAKLKWSLWVIILVYNITLASLYAYAPQIIINYSTLITGASLCYLIGVSSIYTIKLRPLAITFTITNVAQLFVLLIRNVTVLLTESNILTTFLVSADSYLWAALCFILFRKDNTKKEDMRNGNG